MTRPYVPIDCEFHDVLEATAVRRRVAVIHHLDDDGRTRVLEGRIADLYAAGAVEYMRLDDGNVIRLDRIVSIDGERLDAYQRR
ncbi:hypothetical protein [Lysobacter arvi]|uniref:Rho-binding antiterminator n=1 Tax=Lysobacter arvi TaxID=3038776 RepID=A0ABU1CCX2_9GAMM|nr:hypothetical protein [Lysobacter arvi]MDR0181897.1 hypothetical protein [Lysobacter arvi]